MPRNLLPFAALAAALCVAPLTAANAQHERSGWDKFEAGVKRGFHTIGSSAEGAADDVEHGAKKSWAWTKRTARDVAKDDDDDDFGFIAPWDKK